MSNDPTAKVLFRVPDDEGGATVETLWAVPLGGDRYTLDNSPFMLTASLGRIRSLRPLTRKRACPLFSRLFQSLAIALFGSSLTHPLLPEITLIKFSKVW